MFGARKHALRARTRCAPRTRTTLQEDENAIKNLASATRWTPLRVGLWTPVRMENNGLLAILFVVLTTLGSDAIRKKIVKMTDDQLTIGVRNSLLNHAANGRSY